MGMSPMSIWKIIIRECLILIGSVSIFPALVFALMAQQHSWDALLSGALREVLSGAIYRIGRLMAYGFAS